MSTIFKKKVTKTELPEHYSSIDFMPVIKWDLVHKKMDMTYMLVKPQKLNEDQIKQLTLVWQKMYEEFIEVFGFSEQVKDTLNLEIKIANLKLKKIITGDKSIDNFIRTFTSQLNTLKEKKGSDSVDIYSVKNSIEEHMNVSISMTSCTVREFYSYLRDLKKRVNKNN